MMRILEKGSRMTWERQRMIRVVEDVSGGESCQRNVLFCLLRCEELKVERPFSWWAFKRLTIFDMKNKRE